MNEEKLKEICKLLKEYLHVKTEMVNFMHEHLMELEEPEKVTYAKLYETENEFETKLTDQFGEIYND